MSLFKSSFESVARVARVAVVTLGVLLLITFSTTTNIHCQSTTTNLTLSTQGYGSLNVPVTDASITISIESQQESASAAQRDVGSKSTSVINVLRGINFVTKLRTASITLYPIYPSTINPSITIPVNESMRIIGYKSSNTISFQVTNLSIIGEVLDKLIELGITQISNINLMANETVINNAREEALSLAVEDAKSKIEKVLMTLHPDLAIETIRTRLSTFEVNIDSVNRPFPVAFPYFTQGAYRMDAAQSQSVPVVGGDQTIDSYVTVKMIFKPSA